MFVGEALPGVGISIGLTRLMRKLMDANLLQPLSASPAQVMVINFQQELMDTYLTVSQRLRSAGINVVTSFEAQKVGKQFQQADKLGIPLCVIIGPDELAAQEAKLKILKTGEQTNVGMNDLINRVKEELERG
jgi:histidyl-tRNA synthetase